MISPFFSDNDFWDKFLLVLCATVLATAQFWLPMIWGHCLEAFDPIKEYLRLQAIQRSDGSHGLLYEYQGLAAGALAVIAGVLALTVPMISHALDAYKKRNDFIKKVRAVMIHINSQFISLRASEYPHTCNYNIQELTSVDGSFLSGDFYWTLRDEEAYAAHRILQSIETGKRALVGYTPINEEGHPNLRPLDIALLNFCFALDSAVKFMASSFDNKLEITSFIDNPSLKYFQEKARGPVLQFLNKGNN